MDNGQELAKGIMMVLFVGGVIVAIIAGIVWVFGGEPGPIVEGFIDLVLGWGLR